MSLNIKGFLNSTENRIWRPGCCIQVFSQIESEKPGWRFFAGAHVISNYRAIFEVFGLWSDSETINWAGLWSLSHSKMLSLQSNYIVLGLMFILMGLDAKPQDKNRAPSAIVNYGCQCSNLIYRDENKKTHGNCERWHIFLFNFSSYTSLLQFWVWCTMVFCGGRVHLQGHSDHSEGSIYKRMVLWGMCYSSWNCR